MKRKARERLPRRAPGAFPSYLYKSLDELEGAWGEPGDTANLVKQCHVLHCKPLLLLSDEEVGLALRQHIGLQWVRTLALIRLRQDPMRLDEVYDEGDLLRYALQLAPSKWGDLASELLEIADAIVPTLLETPDTSALIAQYRHFRDSA